MTAYKKERHDFICLHQEDPGPHPGPHPGGLPVPVLIQVLIQEVSLSLSSSRSSSRRAPCPCPHSGPHPGGLPVLIQVLIQVSSLSPPRCMRTGSTSEKMTSRSPFLVGLFHTAAGGRSLDPGSWRAEGGGVQMWQAALVQLSQC
ncbi:uncharacterized protein V6R79_025027 [Siganus canaliculatus]